MAICTPCAKRESVSIKILFGVTYSSILNLKRRQKGPFIRPGRPYMVRGKTNLFVRSKLSALPLTTGGNFPGETTDVDSWFWSIFTHCNVMHSILFGRESLKLMLYNLLYYCLGCEVSSKSPNTIIKILSTNSRHNPHLTQSYFGI